MNRVNPLHIALLGVVVLVFVMFKLHSAKAELLEVKNAYNETQKVSDELSSLKKVYADDSKAKKSLLKILNMPLLRSLEIDKELKKSGAKISIKSIDVKGLNLFMGKILNDSFNVKALKIKKLSEKKVSLDMEIKW